MVIQEKHYTAEDLWALSHLPENANKRLYIIDGELFTMSPTGWKHGKIASELTLFIGMYVKQHSLGIITAAETGYILDPGTTLAPDVGFVAAARVPDKLPDGYVPFAPDLAVEVVSPTNTAAEMRDKIEKYLQHGTQLVWVVYPDKQKVDVWRPAEEQTLHVDFLGAGDTLDGGDVLPGFTLPIADIFKS